MSCEMEAGIPDSDKELVAILFPGLVKDDKKAVECLGGIRNISQVYSQPNKKRLGLSFQPKNPFVKKMHADIKKTSGIVFKVKVKKSKDGNEVKREVVSTSVIGRVSHMYKFESMCDFQYLPVTDGENSKCITEEILPGGLDQSSFLQTPSIPFIVPSHFTRSDRPSNYAYNDKKLPSNQESAVESENDVHRRTRSDRTQPFHCFSFNLVDELPTEPNDNNIEQKNLKTQMFPTMEADYNVVKKMFDERPIWSQSLIRFITKFKIPVLKVILPCLAFYYKNGPWRALWVRLGYDPRKDPEARKYQNLDFRLRAAVGFRTMVKSSSSLYKYKKTADRVRIRPNNTDPCSNAEISESSVYFRPDITPTQRQIFYQYCDIQIPEVEEIVAREPPAGYLCHLTRGWYPPGTSDTVRDHMFKYVKAAFIAAKGGASKSEQLSSDEAVSDEEPAAATDSEMDIVEANMST